MSGGADECVAAYVDNDNSSLTTYGSSLVNADAKYKDVYTPNDDTRTGNYSSTSSKVGDAVYETSSSTTPAGALGYPYSWYSDGSSMPYSNWPFFLRGGRFSIDTDAGLFCFDDNVGDASSINGFRPVFVLYKNWAWFFYIKFNL